MVAVDPPGLGDSDKLLDGYDTETVAARLHELVRSLGWKTFHFVGHDIGVWIGYAYASIYLEQVRKLVLMDASAITARSSATWPRTACMPAGD